MKDPKTIIIGAGPAGMGCAYTLAQGGRPFLLLDANSQVGGLCRTVDFEGYLFDIGGHRFLTKSEEIGNIWHKVLGDDLLKVKRLSRIYYRKRFFKYPLAFWDTLWNLGPFESLICFLDYSKHKIFPVADNNTFEGWVINNFGQRLYNIFFKPYTEKIWAMPCRDISSDWAKQRIRGLSLRVAVKNALFGAGKKSPKSFSKEFLYPRKGPGEFYRHLQEFCLKQGNPFSLDTKAVKIKHDGKKIIAVETVSSKKNKKKLLQTEYLFSSMPLPNLVLALEPAAPKEIVSIAGQLKFRSLITVNIILDKEKVFPDQWLYIHSSQVKLGRIQNFKNWSPFMVVDPKKTSLGLEYFCSKEDELWQMDDIELINFALKELTKIGFALRSHLIGGFVLRCANAYPVYSLNYQAAIASLRTYLENFSNLQTMGRSGLFRYDNSDHAFLTGIYAAKNYAGGQNYDLWGLGADQEYLES